MIIVYILAFLGVIYFASIVKDIIICKIIKNGKNADKFIGIDRLSEIHNSDVLFLLPSIQCCVTSSTYLEIMINWLHTEYYICYTLKYES